MRSVHGQKVEQADEISSKIVEEITSLGSEPRRPATITVIEAHHTESGADQRVDEAGRPVETRRVGTGQQHDGVVAVADHIDPQIDLTDSDGVVTSSAVDPRLERIGAAIDAELPLELLDPEPFVELPRPPRLGRFSRYWREAEAVVWEGYSPAR